MFSSCKTTCDACLHQLQPTNFNQYHEIHASIDLDLLRAQIRLSAHWLLLSECVWEERSREVLHLTSEVRMKASGQLLFQEIVENSHSSSSGDLYAGLHLYIMQSALNNHKPSRVFPSRMKKDETNSSFVHTYKANKVLSDNRLMMSLTWAFFQDISLPLLSLCNNKKLPCLLFFWKTEVRKHFCSKDKNLVVMSVWCLGLCRPPRFLLNLLSSTALQACGGCVWPSGQNQTHTTVCVIWLIWTFILTHPQVTALRV